MIVGTALLGWYEINEGTALFAEIGVVLLLFRVGLETRPADLLRVGPQAGASDRGDDRVVTPRDSRHPTAVRRRSATIVRDEEADFRCPILPNG